jgi:hypothetical protein
MKYHLADFGHIHRKISQTVTLYKITIYLTIQVREKTFKVLGVIMPIMMIQQRVIP